MTFFKIYENIKNTMVSIDTTKNINAGRIRGENTQSQLNVNFPISFKTTIVKVGEVQYT